MQRRLRRNGPSAPSVPAALRGIGQLLDYDVPDQLQDETGRPSQRHERGFGSKHDKPYPPSVPAHRRLADVDLQKQGYMRGCHLGYSDYFRRWVNQESIRGRDPNEVSDYEIETGRGMSIEEENIAIKEWDIDGNLTQFYFRRAISGLPNLQHIIYGDYRSLAFDGETYASLCRRLFGRTVCPSMGFADLDYGSNFFHFWNDLTAFHRTWTSLSIGRHPFETSYVDQGIQHHPGEEPSFATQSDVKITYDRLFLNHHASQFPTLQVRSLKLPTLDADVDDIEQFGTLSEKFGQGLIELDLGSTSFYTYSTPQAGLADSHDMIRPLLLPSQPDFPTLRSVTLRGFVFDVPTMQDFLLSLAQTLRTLRLTDCFRRDPHDGFHSFAKDTVAPAIELTGVELYGSRFDDATASAAERWTRLSNEQFRTMRREDQILDEDDPVMRPNNRVWGTEALKKRGKAFNMDMLSSWPYERLELEATMLGGRANNVTRHVRTEPATSARSYWYNVPMFYA